jgi:hypothetical protein
MLDVNRTDLTCALCEQPIDPAAPAHAVRDKVVCEACRQMVAAVGPRQVLPYAHPGTRRRLVLPVLGALCAVLLLAAVVRFFVVQAQARRARDAEMRALLAQQQAVLAAQRAAWAPVQAQRPTTGPMQ